MHPPSARPGIVATLCLSRKDLQSSPALALHALVQLKLAPARSGVYLPSNSAVLGDMFA